MPQKRIKYTSRDYDTFKNKNSAWDPDYTVSQKIQAYFKSRSTRSEIKKKKITASFGIHHSLTDFKDV